MEDYYMQRKPKVKDRKKRHSGNRCMVMYCSSTAETACIYSMPGPMPSGQTMFSRLQMAWIEFIQKHRVFDHTKVKHVNVCSLHFDESQYNQTHLQMRKMGLRTIRPKLLPDAVPHIYKPDIEAIQLGAMSRRSRSRPSTSRSRKQAQDSHVKKENTKQPQNNRPKDTIQSENTNRPKVKGQREKVCYTADTDHPKTSSQPENTNKLTNTNRSKNTSRPKNTNQLKDSSQPKDSNQPRNTILLENTNQLENIVQSKNSNKPKTTNQPKKESTSISDMEELDVNSWTIESASSGSEIKEMDDGGSTTETAHNDTSQDGESEDDTSQESGPSRITLNTTSMPSSKTVQRAMRTCGKCVACKRTIDCRKCDFCLDMKKFGGPNTLRQKCRLKQCLNKARKRNKSTWRKNMKKELFSRKSKSKDKKLKPSNLNQHDYTLTQHYPTSSESEIEEEIENGIKKMKRKRKKEEREKRKLKGKTVNEDKQQLENTSMVQQFIVDGESWTVMSASSGSEGDKDDDRSSLYLSSPSSSSSSSSSSSPSPSISPVQSPKRQTPSLSSSGFAVLPERQAKVATLVGMMDRMDKGKESHKDMAEERSDEPDDNENALIFCLCRSTDYSQFIISCDYCAKMYHGKCVGVEELAARFIVKYACPPCRDKNPALTVVFEESQPGTESRLKYDEEEISDEEIEKPAIETPQEEKKSNKKAKKKRKMKVCGECIPCSRTEDCGRCKYCKDKTKFGGSNIKKQKCLLRKCSKIRTKSLISKNSQVKKCIYPYQTILYDTSKIPNAEMRKHTSHELRYHHDYALQPLEKTSDDQTVPEEMSEDDEKRTEVEQKAESPEKKLQPKKEVQDWTFKKMTMKLKVKAKEKRKSKKRVTRKCGSCRGCRRRNDCQKCDFCNDMKKYGGEGRMHQKCRLRQCHREGGYQSSKPRSKRRKEGLSSKAKKLAKLREKRKRRKIPMACGACVACRTMVDCGSCIFCLDKRANGGPNTWKKNCVFKQCLLTKYRPTDECGWCRACQKSEDCKYCKPCKDNKKFQRVKKEKCQFRRCLNSNTNNRPSPVPVIVLDALTDSSDSDSCDTGSKDCGDNKALTSSTSRIFEAFPEQIKKWRQDPNFAKEKGIDWEKLESSLEEIKSNLAQIDSKMMKLKEIISKPKEPAIMEVNTQTKEQMSKSCTRGPPIVSESKLCDYLDAQQSKSVMKLRIMCHGNTLVPKVTRRDVCGCPLEPDILTDTDRYCPLSKTKCEKHHNWEKLRQAELDLERLVWLLKLEELLDVGKGSQAVTTTTNASATTTG